MDNLPDEILLKIMVMIGPSELEKLNYYLENKTYKNTINLLTDYIIKKNVKYDTEKYHALIELTPCHKVTLLAPNYEKLTESIKKLFFENKNNHKDFKNWIKHSYL